MTADTDPRTQTTLIYRHLQRTTLTALQALDLYGCARLAARIRDLRTAGIAIRTTPHTTPTGARIAVYSIP
jgi:hypothetical protein